MELHFLVIYPDVGQVQQRQVSRLRCGLSPVVLIQRLSLLHVEGKWAVTRNLKGVPLRMGDSLEFDANEDDKQSHC